MEDVMKLDLYLLLEIDVESSAQEIKKAYRKKALQCHPDKNPDNPQAANLFRQLSKALEILSDPDAKKAYDRVLKARKEKALRFRALDGKRQKLKEELEAKEKLAQERQLYEDSERQMAQQVERLRKEGSRIVELEKELLKKQIEEEMRQARREQSEKVCPRIKVKWSKTSGCNYDQASLRSIFARHGQITCMVLSRKGRSALIEYEKPEFAVSAVNEESKSFSMEWVEGKPAVAKSAINTSSTTTTTTTANFSDFESLVLRKMRQTEERKRLTAQIEADDE